METLKRIPVWAIFLILLLLVNLGWMSWKIYQNADQIAVANQFKVQVLHTNDISGIGIFDVKTKQPLWTEWNFNHDGKPEMENYFFLGKDVFDIALSSNRPPKYSVHFRGPGKSETWWLDRSGSGSFTERIFYDTNGNFSKHEVWYNHAWYPVDRRSGKNGVVVKGQWHQLAFDTNSMWTIEASTNAP